MKTKDKLKEYYRCKHDPIYFIENYILLDSPGGDISMTLYEPQKKYLMSMIRDHFCIVLKSRQIGISTVTRAYIVHALVFFKNVIVGVVSRDGQESTNFCRKVIALIEKLPVWMRPAFPKKTEQSFALANGSELYASQVSLANPGKLFRGPAITIAVIDEAAHIEKIDDGFTGFAPALFNSQTAAKQMGVPFGTFIISTPNKTTGIGKWYYDRWVQANEPDSIYVPHTIHWSEIAKFRDDPNWYKQQCKMLYDDPIKIAQELEMKFLASSNSFYPPETIEILNEIDIEPTSKVHLQKNDLYIWGKPNPNKYYLISVDTASSSGKDNSAIEVLDYVTFEQVGEYVGKMRVDDFCKVVDITTKIFPRNLVIVENNSYGNQVVEYLTSGRGDFNIYAQKQNQAQDLGKKVKPRFRYGLSNNAQTRGLIMDALYTYIKENPSLVKSKRLALELIGLENNGRGKFEAPAGMNDDMALAVAFAGYVRLYDPPLSVAAAEHHEVLEDIMETVDMNFSDGVASFDSATLRSKDEKLSNERANKLLHDHIKNHLFDITGSGGNSPGGNVIDITKILGFDVMSVSNDISKT